MNAIFTWASGQSFCQLDTFKVFVKSLSCVHADKIVFTHDMSFDVQKWLEDSGLIVCRVYAKEVSCAVKDRYLHYWKYLCSHEYDNVLHVDSKDVLFQSDPFENFKRPIVALVNEGMPTTSNGFHLIEQFEFQKDIHPFFKREPRDHHVLNSGVTIGSKNEIKNYFMLMWGMSLSMPKAITDQAIVNYLYHFLQYDPQYEIATSNFCLTGESLKNGFTKAVFKDGLFYSDDVLYEIVHQWDRTDYKEETLSYYLN